MIPKILKQISFHNKFKIGNAPIKLGDPQSEVSGAEHGRADYGSIPHNYNWLNKRGYQTYIPEPLEKDHSH